MLVACRLAGLSALESRTMRADSRSRNRRRLWPQSLDGFEEAQDRDRVVRMHLLLCAKRSWRASRRSRQESSAALT